MEEKNIDDKDKEILNVLLNEREVTGYDLHKKMNYDYTAAIRRLKLLEAKKIVEGNWKVHNDKNKRYYSLTESGKNFLKVTK